MWEANKIAYRGNSSYKRAYRGSTLIWEAKPLFEGLTFTAEKAGSTVKYTKSTVSSAEYSYDAVNWSNANGVTITLNNVGDKVYFRGQITGNQSQSNYAKFTMTGLIAASGNVNSLNNNSDVLTYTYCYGQLFRYCEVLTTTPELPATKLSDYCYWYMFDNCTRLYYTPELPATTLTISCYDHMFQYDTSLEVVVSLPAKVLAPYCYNSMFDNCTSLTDVPELPATTLVNNCYYCMFRGCRSLNKIICRVTTWLQRYTSNWVSGVSSTGDFYNLGRASIPSGYSGIPSGWTEHRTLD